jgi:dTDP-L-rhamnose 4-epimerase
MATVLAAVTGGPVPLVTGQYRLGDVRHITASATRIHTELAWSPTVSFTEGVHDFARAPLRASS